MCECRKREREREREGGGERRERMWSSHAVVLLKCIVVVNTFKEKSDATVVMNRPML